MRNIGIKKTTITLTLHLKIYIIDSELQEETRNRLLSKFFIQSNESVYVWHWKPWKGDFSSCLPKKKTETKDKWNKLNLLDIKSLLGTNHRLPLSYMAKSYIYLEEKKQHINDFYIGYTMNPNLNLNKAFREQVKLSLKQIYSTSTMTQISKILLKKNTRVLALVMFYTNRKKCK